MPTKPQAELTTKLLHAVSDYFHDHAQATQKPLATTADADATCIPPDIHPIHLAAVEWLRTQPDLMPDYCVSYPACAIWLMAEHFTLTPGQAPKPPGKDTTMPTTPTSPAVLFEKIADYLILVDRARSETSEPTADRLQADKAEREAITRAEVDMFNATNDWARANNIPVTSGISPAVTVLQHLADIAHETRPDKKTLNALRGRLADRFRAIQQEVPHPLTPAGYALLTQSASGPSSDKWDRIADALASIALQIIIKFATEQSVNILTDIFTHIAQEADSIDLHG